MKKFNPIALTTFQAGQDEEMILHRVDLGQAHATYALKSLRGDYCLSGWWRQQTASVHVHN